MRFDEGMMSSLWRPETNSSGNENGLVTIVGGSELFYGAPLMAVIAASRLVDSVFFSSPSEDLEEISKFKSGALAFIYVPFEEIGEYIKKSDSVLVGPGFMRYHKEGQGDVKKDTDKVSKRSLDTTLQLLRDHGDKKWVIDAGSLQVIRPEMIPAGAVVTPNREEFEMLFGVTLTDQTVKAMALKYKCVIVAKGPIAYVSDGNEIIEIHGGNPGLTKGGVGDVTAGMIVGLLAKNPPLLAACCGTYLVKKTAEVLFEKVGYGFNSEDLALEFFHQKKKLIGF